MGVNMEWRKELELALSRMISSMAIDNSGQKTPGTVTGRHRRSAIDVLCRHPEIEQLLKTSDRWHLYSLTSGYPYSTEKLKSQLIDLVLGAAKRISVESAVCTCDKLFTGAAERNLPGFDLTFFVGIKLRKRWDIIPGLSAVPYKSFQQQFGRRERRPYDRIVFGLDPKDEKNITVLVNELRWGPIIVSSRGTTLKDPYPVEMRRTYNYNSFLLIGLLSVTLNCPFVDCGLQPKGCSLGGRLSGSTRRRRHLR